MASTLYIERLLEDYHRSAKKGDEERQSDILGQIYHRTDIEWCLCLAKQGDPEAQLILGMMTYHGILGGFGCEAHTWFTYAAKAGSAKAQHKLGKLYEYGKGVEVDKTVAIKWYTKAADQGHKPALFDLCSLYERLEDKHCHLNTAFKWFVLATDQGYSADFKWCEQLAEQGDEKVQFFLGKIYHDGCGVTQNYQTACKWFTLAANQENSEAQFRLGLMHLAKNNVYCIEQESKTGLDWMKKAARQGHTIAQYHLGNYYSNRYDKNNNYEAAINWYTLSANQGNAEAQYQLGEMYKAGLGVQQDYKIAQEWFSRAAEQGLWQAQRGLITILEDYNGEEQDYFNALRLYYLPRSSFLYASPTVNFNYTIEPGDNGQYTFDDIHCSESSVSEKIEAAIKWYKITAELGNVEAQYHLGWIYENGEYVHKDNVLAKKWYTKAAEQGHYHAQQYLKVKLQNEGNVHEFEKISRKWDDIKSDVERNNTAHDWACLIRYALLHDKKSAVTWLEIIATQGNFVAQYYLGLMYMNGAGTERDHHEAMKWFSLAAENKLPAAVFALAVMYKYGYGVSIDLAKSSTLIELANEQSSTHGNSDWITLLDYRLLQDDNALVLWITTAADNGNYAAQYYLGLMYLNGEKVTQDNQKAHEWMTKAASQKIAAAQFCLGRMYLEGNGVSISKENRTTGSKSVALAAEQGYAPAQYYLGFKSWHSDNDNYRSAIEWLKLAAKQEYAPARNLLGVMYEEGKALVQDNYIAQKYYSLAMKKGNDQAKHNLRVNYLYGDRVTKNFNEALHYLELDEPYRKNLTKNCNLSTVLNRYIQEAMEDEVGGDLYFVGNMFNAGYCVPMNKKKAVDFFTLAAKMDYFPAQKKLAYMYRHGNVVDMDIDISIMWYERAIENYNNKDKKVDIELARMYCENGLIESELEFIENIAYDGDTVCQYELGCFYSSNRFDDYGIVDLENYNSALVWLLKAARSNHASALYDLIALYQEDFQFDTETKLYTGSYRDHMSYSGELDDYDEQIASRCIKQKAVLGIASAQYKLGEMYEKNENIHNPDEAVKWYTFAAEQNYSNSVNSLNQLYFRELEEEDPRGKTVIEWLSRFAQEGDAHAQFLLGMRYHSGSEVDMSYKTAYKWLKSSAEQGFHRSQFNLGDIFYKGDGVSKDYDKAVKWYELAAEQDNKDAQYRLGMIYSEGEVVSTNYFRAYYWFILSEENDHDDYRDKIKNLAQHLSEDQKKQAKQEVANFKMRKYKSLRSSILGY